MPQRLSLGFTTWTEPLPVDLVAAVFELVVLFFFVVFFAEELEAVARVDDVLDGFDSAIDLEGGGGASVYS